MAVLAKAAPEDLEAAWSGVAAKPDWRWLRKPETGLVMVRGRAGGSGQPFNLGEITVTRCVLVTGDGHTGHAYVAGRDHRHSELAALFDALLQDDAQHDGLCAAVLDPLQDKQARQAACRATEAAATKVDFFTMVRGED